jgi:hypothetical protein
MLPLFGAECSSADTGQIVLLRTGQIEPNCSLRLRLEMLVFAPAMLVLQTFATKIRRRLPSTQ